MNGYRIKVKGRMVDLNQNEQKDGDYETEYLFYSRQICVHAKTKKNVTFVLPVISQKREYVTQDDGNVWIEKEKKTIQITANKGVLELPYGINTRIYNLVPGVEALKITIKEENGEIDFSMLF